MRFEKFEMQSKINLRKIKLLRLVFSPYERLQWKDRDFRETFGASHPRLFLFRCANVQCIRLRVVRLAL